MIIMKLSQMQFYVNRQQVVINLILLIKIMSAVVNFDMSRSDCYPNFLTEITQVTSIRVHQTSVTPTTTVAVPKRGDFLKI